ncbi:MAG: hypothetical protein RL588_1768 [Pseudomonadota bacterium]|jgi:hypothetical protein
MAREDRRAQVQAWKEGRKSRAGIFRVACAPAGTAWLGVSRNLDSQQNSIWFSLRHGGSPNREMQAAWKTHGEDAFVFDEVEVVDVEELSAYLVNQRLQERLRHWCAELGAGRVVA